MDAIRFQRRRADAASNPNPVLGDGFIAHGPDHGRRHHQGQVGDLLRVDEAVDGLVASESGGAEDNGKDGQPQRHGCQGIDRIVQGVAQESHRATRGHHKGLDSCGEEQDDKRDRHDPNAISTPFEDLIHRVFGIMGVRSHEGPQGAYKPFVGVFGAVGVRVLMAMRPVTVMLL